jgi:hypothetical protein
MEQMWILRVVGESDFNSDPPSASNWLDEVGAFVPGGVHHLGNRVHLHQIIGERAVYALQLFSISRVSV